MISNFSYLNLEKKRLFVVNNFDPGINFEVLRGHFNFNVNAKITYMLLDYFRFITLLQLTYYCWGVAICLK